MIVEFSEGTTMSLAESSELKSFITIRTDTIRRPYGRYTEDIPRRCVFAMSTNDTQYLKDETGNRRYLPIEVQDEVNIDWLKENRDQLFAEAVKRVRDGEDVYLIPFEEAEKKQMDRLMSSPYEDIIDEWLKDPKYYSDANGGFMSHNIAEDGITIADVWIGALDGSKNRITRREEMMIARALQKLGLEKIRAQINGIQKIRWFKANG